MNDEPRRRQKLARRYVRTITKTLQNITKLRLSVTDQAKLIESTLARLTTILRRPEDTAQPAIPLSQLQLLSNSLSEWMSSVSTPATPSNQRTQIAGISALFIALIPPALANQPSCPSHHENTQALDAADSPPRLHNGRDRGINRSITEPEQHYSSTREAMRSALTTMQIEQTRFLDSISPLLSVKDLCSCIQALCPEDWLSLSPTIIDTLAEAILATSFITSTIYQCMPHNLQITDNAPLRQQARLHQLHRYLHDHHLQSGSVTSRMFGPDPAKRDTFHVTKFLLSSLVLGLRPSISKNGNAMPGKYKALALVQKFRRLFLPPDRQVITAALQLACIGNTDILQHLEAEDIFSWLWKEWNLLRENEPDSMVDEILLVAFLETASDLAIVKHSCLNSAETSDSLSVPLWVSQAYTMAQSKVVPYTGVPIFKRQYKVQQDDPLEMNARIFRITAVAAIHLGQYQTAFTILLDERLPARHILPVFGTLASHIDLRESENAELAAALARVSADHLPRLVPRIPKSMSPAHAQHLASLIEVLIRRGHNETAQILLNVPRNLLLFGTETLQRLFRTLSHGSGSGLLKKLYRQLEPSAWPIQHLLVFLSSRSHSLSDTVWAFVQTRPDLRGQRFLDARLRHHLRTRQLRYYLAMQDCESALVDTKSTLEGPTLAILLDIHIRAGSGRRALQTYHQLCETTPEAPGMNVRFLRIASLPSWAKYRRRGPRSQLLRLGSHLEEIVSKGTVLDPASALYIVQQSLRWAELDDEAIWTIVKSGAANAQKLNWQRDLKPMFLAVKAAFRRRGNYEAAREVVDIMIQSKKDNARVGSSRVK